MSVTSRFFPLLVVFLSITSALTTAQADQRDVRKAHAEAIANPKDATPTSRQQRGTYIHDASPWQSEEPLRWIDNPASPGG